MKTQCWGKILLSEFYLTETANIKFLWVNSSFVALGSRFPESVGSETILFSRFLFTYFIYVIIIIFLNLSIAYMVIAD